MSKWLLLLFVFVLSTCFVHATAFRIDFEEGWNLFSMPLRNPYFMCKVSKVAPCPYLSPVVENTCGSIIDVNAAAYKVFAYDTESKKYVRPQAGEGNMDWDLGLKKGYWFKAGKKCFVEFKGSDFDFSTTGDFKLGKGWNLIGALSQKTFFDDVSGECDVLKGPYYYNASRKGWVKSTTLEQGKGYFVKVDEDCNLGGVKTGKTWITVTPRMCGNAWENATSFTGWLKENGVNVLNYFNIPHLVVVPACAMCSCTSGSKLFVLVDKK